MGRTEEAEALKYVIEYSVLPLLTILFSGDFRDIVGRWQSKRLKFHIPSVAELTAFLDQPLLDNEKIPLDPERFQSLINMTRPGGDWCSRDDVEALFCSEDGNSVLDQFFFVVSEAPPRSGTESSFHSFWDANVRKILEFLLPGGWSTRDSSRHTATGMLRPDFAFILSKLCPFRGEEEPPGSDDNPKAELSTKLAWAYDPAPYVLGQLMSSMFPRYLADHIIRVLCHWSTHHSCGNHPAWTQ